ncbi:hypothetical protein DKX38_022068 [Salix brachista]|uniref:CCHC-type domain-containing protein n=1 Tax=Salix brachista TaxID=2182728 RepID=A0A5N5JYS3_9ROSI|nr:hypothetical protein DKX38_022068 [Salix brachista]
MFENRVPHMLDNDYTPYSALDIFVKDLGIVTRESSSLKVPLHIATVAHQLFLAGRLSCFPRNTIRVELFPLNLDQINGTLVGCFYHCSLVFLDQASATSVGIRARFFRDDSIMPPRRRPAQVPVDIAIERDRMAQLEQQVEQLTAQLAAARANQNQYQALNPDTSSDEVEEDPRPRRGQRAPLADDRVEDFRRWESGMRTEVPEFRGSMQPEEFLEWLGVAEDILEFKRVPANERVALVATRFRGRAAAWWQQCKLARNRAGKPKLVDWEKMKRKLRAEFLPHNFARLMYQRLQNLRQGIRSVDEYTTEFYELLVRNDIEETQDQLVSRYCGGLRTQILDMVNLFDPLTVTEAHQRALQLEKTLARKPGSGPLSGFGSGLNNRNRATVGSSSGENFGGRTNANNSTIQRTPTINIQTPCTTGGFRCFGCGETGHRLSECPKPAKGVLFIDPAEFNEEDAEIVDETQSGEEEATEDFVDGDTGTMLMELHGEGHVGRDRTLQLVKASYYWPTIRKEVESPIDLIPLPSKTRVHGKAEDFVQGLQEIHKQASALIKDICGNLSVAAKSVENIDYTVVLRGDSTLRDAVVSLLGEMDAWIICPFFLQGGRYTINDIHYVADSDWYKDPLVSVGS